jgi:hypothetical protein
MPMKRICAGLLAALASMAFAQDVPVPKMFEGLKGQKGQYRVEILEGGGRAGKGTTITVCSDNLIKDAGGGRGRDAARGEPNCKHKLLKDTNDEAVIESVCKERTSTVTMKRDGKSVLMDIASKSPGGDRTMKMRYTHLGPCKEGQGAVSLDKDSEQCRKVRERAAKMDPDKQCAKAKDREQCEQRVRDAAARLSAMCS